MRTLPKPKITAQEFRRKTEYFIGDVVRITNGKHAGRVAEIIGIEPYTTKEGEDALAYCLKLSDRVGIATRPALFRLVKPADDVEI